MSSESTLRDLAKATESPSFYRDSGGRDSSDNAAAANAARIAAEKATYEQQQAQAAAAQKAAADNAARIAAERATYDQQQRAAQAASDNAARIAAEKASYEMPSAPSAPSSGTSLSDVINQIIGITPAEAGNKVIGTGGYLPDVVRGGKPFENSIEANKYRAEEDAAKAQQEAFNTAKTQADLAEQISLLPITGFDQPIGQTTKFNKDQSGIVPAGVWTDQQMTMPDVRQAAEAARIAAAQPADTFFTDLQRVNDKLAAIRGMDTANLVGSGRGVAGPTAEDIQAARAVEAKPNPLGVYSQATRPAGAISPFEAAVRAAISPAPTENVYNYTPTFTPPPVSKVNMADYSQTGDTTPVTTQTDTEPAPETVKTAAQAAAAPVLAVAKKAAVTTPATAPAVQKGVLDQLLSGVDAANAKRIAELEQSGEFAGGNKAQVASALGVDPSELKSRIVFQDGKQKVDYYTKGLDQALGEAITAPFQAVSNLFGSNVNNLPRGSYVRDPRFSDLFSQNVPSKGYGPYGDLTAEEYRQQYGGRDVTQPVTPTSVPVTPAPVTPTPVPPAPPSAQSAWSRTRTGLPYDPYNYGYGGEYTYYSAEGGPVSPLNKIRK